MPDENNTGDPQAGDPAQINPQPQAGATTTPEPQAGDGKTASKSADDYERMIAELRKEAAGYRTKNKKYEEEEAKRAEAQLSEQQKLEKRNADLQKSLDDTLKSHQEYKINAEVRLQAAQLGFADLSDAMRLLDLTAIEYDQDGAPSNVKNLLSQLLKAKPYLAGKPATQPSSGGATNPPRSITSGQAEVTDAFIASLTPSAYAELSPDMKLRISQFMTNRVGTRR